MGDKIRGAIAIIFGLLGIFEGYILYQEGHRDWRLLVAAVGALMVAFGIWRVRRKPPVPTAELLK
jgi:hypothetical protein